MSKQTVTINGVKYDSQTGLPVSPHTSKSTATKIDFAPASKIHPAASIHRTVQKSQTLKRRTVKKVAISSQNTSPTPTKKIVTRSAAITKFAPHPSAAKPARPQRFTDFKAAPTNATKPAAAAAAPLAKQRPASAPKPSQIIKQEAIADALAKAPSTKKADKASKLARRRHKKSPHSLTIASASLALLLLGGYFTYLNMPNLSVRVAAAQAGVQASYPSYHPDGYSIRGLVTYSQDTVNMTFTANGGPQSYTVAQTKSNLDSSAVLENYVKPKVGGSYIPYSQQGLTVYVFGNDAAWVNRGILYTINGDAPLSSEQILHIASSM